jgi:hypothetical protein
MSVRDFDNGYWYAAELKRFAASIGIASAHRLRKDELETAIRRFLASGKIPLAVRPKAPASGTDAEKGLRLGLPVRNFKNEAATWDFIEAQARRLDADYKKKSGARYRLNRWREDQIAQGVRITYGDLVREYAALSRTQGPFAHVPQDRYVNFLSDFFAAEKGATRDDALRAWRELKTLDVPKNYRSWRKSR